MVIVRPRHSICFSALRKYRYGADGGGEVTSRDFAKKKKEKKRKSLRIERHLAVLQQWRKTETEER